MDTFKKFYLTESIKSEAHETDIKEAFKGLTLPDELPPWMHDIGLVPGANVVSSKKTNVEKADVVVTFDIGRQLKISAKLSNAQFFGNWFTKKGIIRDFGNKALRRIEVETLNFVNSYIPDKKYGVFVGCGISFGKRVGNTGMRFDNLIGGVDELRKIIVGPENSHLSANALYMTNKVPKTIKSLIRNLRPINNRNLHELLQNFYVIFRPLYASTPSNLKNQSHVRLIADKKQKPPVYVGTQEEIMNYSIWKKPEAKLDKTITGTRILKNIKSKNIFPEK